MIKLLSLLKGNKFISNSILYVIGTMITPAIGLIMLPIYTSYLSPSEYGTLTTIQTLVGMFQLILLLSLNSAINRFFYDYLNNIDKQKEYLGSIFIFVIIFSTSISFVLLLFKDFIGQLLFSSIPIQPFYFYLIGIAWASSLFVLPLALWRAQEKAGLFVAFNIVKSILIMLISTYLIIIKGYGAEGALLAHFVISFLFVIFSFIISKKSIKIALNRSHIKSSLLFSIPLLPHVASTWIIKSSDRIILEKYVNLEELGLYSLAAQVALVLSLFYTGINNAMVPRYTRLRKENKNNEAKRLLKTFAIIVLMSGVFAIPIAMFAVDLLITSEFSGAIIFLPLIIIGEVIKGFYFIPVAKLFYTKSTKSIATSSSIAAIVNIILNFVFIPVIGAYGAIIATIIAELIRFLLIFLASKKINKKFH